MVAINQGFGPLPDCSWNPEHMDYHSFMSRKFHAEYCCQGFRPLPDCSWNPEHMDSHSFMSKKLHA